MSLDRRVTKLEAIVEVLCAEIAAQSGRVAALSAAARGFPREGDIEVRGGQIRALSLDLRVTKLEKIVETLRGEVVKQSKQIAKLSATTQ